MLSHPLSLDSRDSIRGDGAPVEWAVSTGRVGYEDLGPWNYAHTLAGELSRAGYYTQCIGKMF